MYTCWLAALMGTSIVRTPNTWVVLDSVRPRHSSKPHTASLTLVFRADLSRNRASSISLTQTAASGALTAPFAQGIVFSTLIVHSSRDYDLYFASNEPYPGIGLTEDISLSYSHDLAHHSDNSTLYNRSTLAGSRQHLDV